MIVQQINEGDFVTLETPKGPRHGRYVGERDYKISKVVFDCSDDWENYEKYPNTLVYTKQLKRGWIKEGKTIRI